MAVVVGQFLSAHSRFAESVSRGSEMGALIEARIMVQEDLCRRRHGVLAGSARKEDSANTESRVGFNDKSRVALIQRVSRLDDWWHCLQTRYLPS